MKIKIFSEINYVSLENEINKFIKTVKVLDVKFCSDISKYSVLIMYENT